MPAICRTCHDMPAGPSGECLSCATHPDWLATVCADCGAESVAPCLYGAGTCSECSTARDASNGAPCPAHPYYPAENV